LVIPTPMAWLLLSNHGHVLLYVGTFPDARLREVAAAIGITERAAHKIVTELEEAGYISRERVGRRNHYTVHREAPLRHARVVGRTVGDLLSGLEPEGYRGRAGFRAAEAELHEVPEASA
jgi:DNA-binding Lrp family transcriptional regulator